MPRGSGTFTLAFDTDTLGLSSLCVRLHWGATVISVTRPIEDVMLELHAAIAVLSGMEEGTVTVKLAPDEVCDALLEKAGAIGSFTIISRQPYIGAPKDGKERLLVSEEMDFEKLKRRICKGIDRFLNDPRRTKGEANKPVQSNADSAPRSSGTDAAVSRSPRRV